MELLQECLSQFPTAANAKSCNKDNLQEVCKLAFWTKDATITAVGDIPTPTEVESFFNAGNGAIIDIGAGVLAPETPKTIDATQTQSGLVEMIGATQQITGQITYINNKIREMVSRWKLNNYIVQMGFVTRDGRWHGEKTGWQVALNISDFSHAGKGNQAVMPITLDFEKNVDVFYKYSDIDKDYLTLDNLATIGTYSISANVGTTHECIDLDSYEKITGWNKTTYPTLYFKYTTAGTEIAIYASSATRTAGTPKLATIDISAGETVTAVGGSGFGGSIDIVKVDFTDADTWDVLYE